MCLEGGTSRSQSCDDIELVIIAIIIIIII